MNKLIVYGDIHGCYDEFINLRKKTNPKKNDVEVCVGDFITKGKDSIKTLDYLIKHNIKSVLGNHEDKLIRYLKHQVLDKENPIVLDEDEKCIIGNLTQKHINYLEGLPIYLKYDDVTILHGGIQNNINLDALSKRDTQEILECRYLDLDENFLVRSKEDENSIFWADVYDGNQGFVVYGHRWFKEANISKYAIGIDTGCVYGNELSAVIFENNNLKNYKIESVKNYVCK